ncbi:MAG: hypothetical protein N3G48_05110 [Sulfolobales archaeon]|nr:hypothetical protein [Sulfolobales archaeon]
MKLHISAWCTYIPRYRKNNGKALIPVLGPDEDLVTMSYESCRILRQSCYHNVKTLIYVSSDKTIGVKSALLADLLKLSDIRKYDVNDLYHLVGVVQEVVDDGDVLAVSSDSSSAAAAVSMVLSKSGGYVEVVTGNSLINSPPLLPGKDAKNDFHAELYLNKLSKFLKDLIDKAGIKPQVIKYVATNIKDLRYCSKVLRSVGISDLALEPSKYVAAAGHFNTSHTPLTLIRTFEISSPGDYILLLDSDENFSRVTSLILKVNEDLLPVRGCVNYLDKLLNNSSVITLQ